MAISRHVSCTALHATLRSRAAACEPILRAPSQADPQAGECPVQFGAACGLLVGHGVRAMVACIDGAEPVSLSLYAAVGAAAFLSGCVRYKSTAVLIAMESMGAWFLVVPIAVAGTPPATVPFAVAVGTWPSFSLPRDGLWSFPLRLQAGPRRSCASHWCHRHMPIFLTPRECSM